MYHEHESNITQNNTIVYARLVETETTIENVTFVYNNGSVWQSTSMNWIEPGVYGTIIPAQTINTSTVEWRVDYNETALLRTEPHMVLTATPDQNELDLLFESSAVLTVTLEVFGINSVDTVLAISTNGPSLNVTQVDLGTVISGTKETFAILVEFTDEGTYQINVTVSGGNFSPLEQLIEMYITDTGQIVVETTEETTTETTTVTTTTTSGTTSGFQMLISLFGLPIYLFWRRTKRR